ncbi:MAG: sigma-70 family RNA polymerase sigma factor [Myxococcales bacterium]|nr:sigma-70 family RNA polymerase sigma factor [Myxococcales bacterium]
MSGDQVAELYRRHAPALQRRCASIVGSSDEARDLVQETFARFLAAKAQDHVSPFAVLYRIATNASIDRLRRRKTAREDELDAEAHVGDLGSEPRRVDNARDLAFLTKGLSEEELTVAVLHHLDGYTQEGIAASLELSRRTVGKILVRFEEHVKKRAARTGFAAQSRASDG